MLYSSSSSSSSVLARRSQDLLFCKFTFLRYMGGGPRTFPGGLSKWQWKRMHEKKAEEKEKKLLDQEKQLYQARIRSQIRAKLSGKSDDRSSSSDFSPPMTAKDHVKALADRFMKEGAEDLWNKDDGPLLLQSPPSPPSPPTPRPPPRPHHHFNNNNNNPGLGGGGGGVVVESSPPSLRNLRNNNYLSAQNYYNSSKTAAFDSLGFRHYSVEAAAAAAGAGQRRRLRLPTPTQFKFKRNARSSSSDDDDDDDDDDADDSKEILIRPIGSESSSKGSQRKNLSEGNSKWPRFHFSQGETEEEEELDSKDNKTRTKKLMSRATLANYDPKTTRRVPKLFVEEEDHNLSEKVDLIREELKRRRMMDSSGQQVRQHEHESLLSQKRFDECSISPLTVKALTSAGYLQMTIVQEATLSVCLDGKDALVKAKTGTGKTAAFLLPAIEAVLKATSSGAGRRVPPILVLILSPTRELASQTAAEANVMLKHHDGIGVQTLIGGTRFKTDQKRLESDPCQIIVATPGRLLDHIENKSGFSVRLMGLKMLILDEADHLLDLGFRKDIEKIVDCVPRRRQSLLFSATVPKEVRRISQLVLKREHVFVDTVGLGATETHAKVKQLCLVATHELHFQIVYQLLKEHISQVVDYKVIVFCTTAMVTSLVFLLLREMKMNVREMHSRKPQLYRTRISDEFRESKGLILVTSDVSARGVNYPDVTLVIQVGIPSEREQYIHRLGRTGREGKNGEGILLLAPWEEYFLDEIKDLPIERSPMPLLNSDVKMMLDEAMLKIDTSVKEAAYHAWLGYYNSISDIGRDKTTLVELANQFSESIQLQKPPSLFRKTASKMGLKDIPGIRIRK